MSIKRDTRAALLDAALEMIWTQSYGGVSVDDICAKAEAKKGSFYHYFSSKSELASAAMEHLWNGMKPELDQLFSPQLAPLDRLKAYAHKVVSDQESGHRRFGYIIGCPFTSVGSEQCSCKDGLSQKSGEIFARVRKYFRSAIQDAVNDGAVPAVEPCRAATELLTYELGALSLARVSNSLEPLEALFDVWMGILRRGAKDELRA